MSSSLALSASGDGDDSALGAAQALTFALRESLSDAARQLQGVLPHTEGGVRGGQQGPPQEGTRDNADHAATAPQQSGSSGHSVAASDSPVHFGTAPLNSAAVGGAGGVSPGGASRSGLLQALGGASDGSGVDLDQLADLLFAKMAPKLQESMQREQ